MKSILLSTNQMLSFSINGGNENYSSNDFCTNDIMLTILSQSFCELSTENTVLMKKCDGT